MKQKVTVALLVVALLCSGSFGLIAAPTVRGNGQATGNFSASAILLKTTGQPGLFYLPEPPGGGPVNCIWDADLFGGGTKYGWIYMRATPVVYPGGIEDQKIGLVNKLYRRLPNGQLQFVESWTVNTLKTATRFVPVDFNDWVPVHGMGFDTDSGSKFLFAHEIRWYDNSGSQLLATAEVLYTSYVSWKHGDPIPTTTPKDSCDPFLPATVTFNFSEGTVNQTVPFTINRFPGGQSISTYFDGATIGNVMTNEFGVGSGSFVVPAAPKGPHTVKWYRYGRTATATFTIKPRIKIIPSVNVQRDQTVNVSLRGYVAHETVRIRWKKGSTWIQIATVDTSSTGSANINVKVPKFVPDGPTSVRGDSVNASGGRAQTNAVTVNGGPFSSSAVKATPTPTKTATPKPTATATPATLSPTPTIAPTQTVASPSATATQTETATPEPTAAPTETPTVEATATLTETVKPTASEETG